MKNTRLIFNFLMLTCSPLSIGNACALEKIAGAFLGATPIELELAEFHRSKGTLYPDGFLHYAKEINPFSLVQVFVGEDAQPDTRAYMISLFKPFKVVESDECANFLHDLYTYLISSEKNKPFQMKNPPIIAGRGLKDFSGTVVEEAYSIDSGNKTIHFYCKIVKDEKEIISHIEANFIITDNAIYSKYMKFLMQKKALKNPLLNGVIK